MATYSELQTEVATNLIDVPTAVQALIGTYLNRALKTLQTRHNFEVMKAKTDVLITQPDTRVLAAVPSNFKEFRLDPVNGVGPYMIHASGDTQELQVGYGRASVEADIPTDAGGENEDETVIGPPQIILRSEPSDEAGSSNFEVWPLSDGLSLYANSDAGEYRIVIPYWKYLTALSASGDTNWFTVNAEEWLIMQATAYGFFTNEDEERATVWTQRAAEKLNEVIGRDKRLQISRVQTLIPHTDAFAARHTHRRDPFFTR